MRKVNRFVGYINRKVDRLIDWMESLARESRPRDPRKQ